MTTDNKTLADVQPGGRVRLGDQDERARFDEFLSRNPLMALCAGTAWQVWQAALSAQPSPGGRRFHHVSQVAERFGMAVTPEEIGAAIASAPSSRFSAESAAAAFCNVQPSPGGQGDARIPFETWAKDGGFDVSKFKGIYNSLETRAAWEAWLYWQRLAARQPVGEPPAQAVDLGKLRLLGQRIEQVGRNAAPAAQGSGNVYFRNVIDWGRELLALIDGKAVGNG